jgi:hypothetical protein
LLTLVDGASLNGRYTLASYDALTTTEEFDAVYYNGVLVADPTSSGGVNGTHQLVYGATSLQLVGPGTSGTAIIVRGQ